MLLGMTLSSFLLLFISLLTSHSLCTSGHLLLCRLLLAPLSSSLLQVGRQYPKVASPYFPSAFIDRPPEKLAKLARGVQPWASRLSFTMKSLIVCTAAGNQEKQCHVTEPSSILLITFGLLQYTTFLFM